MNSLRNNFKEVILSSNRTVFTMQSLSMLLGVAQGPRLTSQVHYYVKTGLLANPRRGIYTKRGYNIAELACSIFRPSYLSLEYVLQHAGVVFQWDDTITSVSYLNRLVVVDGRSLQYRQIEGSLWADYRGIECRDNVAIATPERAFLDMVYLSHGECYFDNLRPLNRAKVMSLLPLYCNKALANHIKTIFENGSK